LSGQNSDPEDKGCVLRIVGEIVRLKDKREMINGSCHFSVQSQDGKLKSQKLIHVVVFFLGGGGKETSSHPVVTAMTVSGEFVPLAFS
jgi:hypothetical protein